MTKAKFYKFTKTSNKKWILVALALILSFGFQLYVTNSNSGRGEELSQIEAKIEEVRRQNQILKEEMARFTAIAKLEETSQSLGLVKPQNVLYLKASESTAHAGSLRVD